MSRYLGMHIQRGQLDAVETMFTDADIAEGLAVKLKTSDTVVVVSAAGDPVYGIAGGKRPGVGVAVVRHGKIWAAADDAAVPALGAPAYATAAGKITSDAGGGADSAPANTLVGYFTSDEVANNGVQNVPSFNNAVKCVQIFVDL